MSGPVRLTSGNPLAAMPLGMAVLTGGGSMLDSL